MSDTKKTSAWLAAKRVLVGLRKRRKHHQKALAECSGACGGSKSAQPHEEWSAKRRQELADKHPSDFAGPNETFPIRNQEDLEHVAELLHHADDPAAVKRRAEAIAHRLGLHLPESWEDKGKEAKWFNDRQDSVSKNNAKLMEADRAGATPADETEPLPHGAQCAVFLIEYLKGELGDLEPEVHPFFQYVVSEVPGWAEERYPDLDFGGEEDVATPEQDEQEANDLLNGYQHAEYKAQQRARFQHLRVLRTKCISRQGLARHIEPLQAACQWTKALVTDQRIPLVHQQAALDHHLTLRRLHTDLTSSDGGGDGKSSEATEQEPVPGSDEEKAVLAVIEKEVAALRQTDYTPALRELGIRLHPEADASSREHSKSSYFEECERDEHGWCEPRRTTNQNVSNPGEPSASQPPAQPVPIPNGKAYSKDDQDRIAEVLATLKMKMKIKEIAKNTAKKDGKTFLDDMPDGAVFKFIVTQNYVLRATQDTSHMGKKIDHPFLALNIATDKKGLGDPVLSAGRFKYCKDTGKILVDGFSHHYKPKGKAHAAAAFEIAADLLTKAKIQWVPVKDAEKANCADYAKQHSGNFVRKINRIDGWPQ